MAEKITVLVATNGQGIMRSSDAGESWTRVGIGQGMHGDAIVRSVASDPARPEVVYAGTELGLYRSDDAGRKWALLDTPMKGSAVWYLLIDPTSPEVIYACTGTPTPAAIFRSDDNAKSWEKLPVPVAESCPNVGTPRFTGLAIDPLETQNLWAGIEVDGVRRSRDGGATWETVNGAIKNPDVHSITVVAGPPKQVIVVVNNGIYTSTDDGATWKSSLAKEDLPMGYPRFITRKPGDPKTLFLAIGDYTPGSTGAIMRSGDAGQNWENLTLPVQPNSSMWAIGTHESNPDLMYAASRYGYLYKSDDGGDSWSKEWRELSEVMAITWVPS